MINKSTTVKRSLFILALIVLAVGWRFINNQFNLAPNLELVTVASVLAAITFGWRASLTVAMSSMIMSDLIIGNTSIFVYTWGSFAVIGIGAAILKKLNEKPGVQILSSAGFAVISSFLFFAITNFGVWAQGWYPQTIAGLIDSYTMAIPFYRTMLIGNIIMVPTAVAAWQMAKAHHVSKQSVIDASIRN